jgi:hypothetical protein
LTPRLILVDGFAGTGKSTAAQRLWLTLARDGREACWIHEHEAGHPVCEYGDVAELLRRTPAQFESRIVAAWHRIATDVTSPGVRILEGSLFQIPVGVMLAMDVPAARIRAMLRRLDQMLAEADASLIYLHRPDLRTALRRLGDLRGPQWLEMMTDAVGRSPYGRRHRVRTLAGVVAYYRRQRAIIDAAFPSLSVRRIAIDVSGDHWDRYTRQMSRFVGLSPAAPEPASLDDLLRHVGHFRSGTGRTCVITTDARMLYLQMPASPTVPLVQVAEGHYCPLSLPIDVRVSYDTRGRAKRLTYTSKMVNEVLPETAWVRSA